MESDWRVKAKDNVREAVSVILNELNGSDVRDISEVIYDRVSHEHRTIQQEFWSALLLAQIRYADNAYDLRNEQAVHLAQRVREVARQVNMDLGLMYL